MKTKRICYRCKKEFETEVKTNEWGMPETDMFCPNCYLIKEHYSKMGKASAAAREEKIIQSHRVKVEKIKKTK